MPKSRSRREQDRNPISKAKARKILRDDEVRGKPLTQKQKGFFGARAGGSPMKRGNK